MPTVQKMRKGQRRFLRLTNEYRILAFLARRQYGKTTTFARIALMKMMKTRDHTVIFGSAKLNLSREVVRKEAQILQAAIAAAIEESAALNAALKTAEADKPRIPDKLTPDDFAELFEAQRLEFRYFHTATSYSRTKIVALRPDTVGETGDLMCDELRAIANWREVWEAVKPIIAANPQFRCVLSTTIPTDDAHYAYGQLMPGPEVEFIPSPEGTLYESQAGIMTLRVDAWDAYADNVPLYDDKTGEPLSPDESRARDQDKDAWDRNYGLVFLAGGTSACGMTQITVAQRRGVGHCLYLNIESDAQLTTALHFLVAHLGTGPVGIGIDVATTTKGTSNPTSVSVVELTGVEYVAPLILTWKTADPRISKDRIRRIASAIQLRPAGGRPRAAAIDATNERYFATELADDMADILPCSLVVGSERHEEPGYEPMTKKQWTASRLVAILDDNHLTIPPERYVRDDWRLVRKEKGLIVCEPDVDGKHGDTFDATKLAIYALEDGGAVEALPVNTGSLPASFTSPWQHIGA
jgi:hypothetical protein